MGSIFFAAMLCVGSTSVAQDAPLIQATFEWPEAQPGVIADLRVSNNVRDARETAREATLRASEGRRAAGQAKRRAGLRGAVGISPQRATVADDTEVALTRGTSEGSKLGSIAYSSGATMTGAFGPDVGVYKGGPDSPLRQFSGWVWGARTGAPRPIDGLFE